MIKIFILLLLMPNIVSASRVCFRGKMQVEIIDLVCFDKEQVETLKVLTDQGVNSLIEIKFLNVPTPITILSDLASLQKKLQ